MESVDGRTQVQRVYQLILDDPDWTPERLQGKLGITHTEVSAALSLMRDLGLLTHDELAPSGMTARSAEAALVNLLREQKTTLSARVDELQRTSAALDTLASQFLSLRNPKPSDTRVDIVVGDDEVTALLRDATAVAYHEVLVLGMDFPGRCADTEFGSSWHRRIIGNGVRMRAVHLCSMARSMRAANRLRMLQRDGVDIRLTPSAPVSIMTFDHFLTIAAIPAFQGTTAVLAIHGHALTGLFRHVFDWCWATSAALGSEALDPPAPQDLSEQQKAVVRMLAAGMKDETIARNLGISQRTLRRLITELMEVLESGSRFQAGVKAAALGWVPASGV